MIYSFEFEECVLAAYNSEPVECTVHGQLDLKELAPDAVSVLKLLELFPKIISLSIDCYAVKSVHGDVPIVARN